MTDVVAEPATPSREAGPPRRRWFWAVAAAVAVALVTGVIVVVVVVHRRDRLALDRQYGPLVHGSTVGPYSFRGLTLDRDGFSYRLSSAPAATAQILSLLDDRGAKPVTVTSIDTGGAIADVRWSTYRFVDNGSAFGVEAPWRAFPATVPAHGTIRLLVTVRHPGDCNAYPTAQGVSEAPQVASLVVHWQSPLGAHVDEVELGVMVPVC